MNQAEQMREAAAACGWKTTFDLGFGSDDADKVFDAIHALPLPEPTPDKRDEALENARDTLEECARYLRNMIPRYDTQHAENCDLALAAINAALSTDAPKPDTRRSEEEVRAEIALMYETYPRTSALLSEIYARIAVLEWTLSGEKNEKETRR